jgi:hypothetical protein
VAVLWNFIKHACQDGQVNALNRKKSKENQRVKVFDAGGNLLIFGGRGAR